MTWIPTAERLPEYGAPVVVYFGKGDMEVGYLYHHDGPSAKDPRWAVGDRLFPIDLPTHWMPLPEPPTEKNL